MGVRKKLEQYFNSMKFRFFMVYFLSLSVLVLVISFFILFSVKGRLVQSIASGRKDTLNQVIERANVIKNSTTTISNLFNFDHNLRNVLDCEEVITDVEAEENLNALKNFYSLVFKDIGLEFDLIVIGENGFRYHSKEMEDYNYASLSSQLWFKKIYDNKNDITFVSSFEDRFGQDNGEYFFSASRIIYNDDGNELGILMININEKYLKQLYEPLLDGDNMVYIVDNLGNVISHDQPGFRGLNYFNHDKFEELYGNKSYTVANKSDGEYLITKVTDPVTLWSIIEEIPASVIFSPVDDMVRLVRFFIVVWIFIVAIISHLISDYATKPMKQLKKSINNLKDGDLTERSNISSFHEINELSDSFNDMAAKVLELLEEVRDKEIYQKELEINFLRAQINPHFLYNTLFSIRCTAEMDRKTELIQMIDAFTALLRTTFSSGTDLICIVKEMENTEKYLLLQQIRYDYRFEFEIQIEDNLRDELIPALILQPIVENSIFHGIESQKDIGLITINAYEINEDTFAIDIIDNGEGITEEKIAEINNSFSKFDVQPENSIGLANVANRIKLQFPKEGKLDIISEEHIGTIVRIILPKRKGENHEGIDS